MFKFDYENFKGALKKVEEDSHAMLMEDIEKVKAFVEKGLTLFLESSSNEARLSYPGADI